MGRFLKLSVIKYSILLYKKKGTELKRKGGRLILTVVCVQLLMYEKFIRDRILTCGRFNRVTK